MDFEKLLKQATAKQKVAEKKHVLQKQHKEESRKRDLDSQKEGKRKAAAKLREMKEAAHRKQLEYKGLMSSSGRVLDSTAASVTTSTLTSSPSVVSGAPSRVTSTDKDKSARDKDRGRREHTTARTQVSSSSSFSKHVRDACSSTKHDKHSHTTNASSMSAKSHKTNKSTPISSDGNAKSATTSLAVKSKSSVGGSTSAPAKPKGKPLMMNNFEDLLNTAKQNATSEKSATKFGKAMGKDTAVLDGGRLKEPSQSSSPLGRSLLERNHSRLKNKRNHDTMMKGISPRGSPGPSTLTPPLPGSSSLGSVSSHPSKSSDLIRCPLRSPITNVPAKQNGMRRKEPQLDKDSSERRDCKMSRQDGSVSINKGRSKGQCTFQQPLSRETTTNKEDGLRGTKTPSLPPPSSLTPQQIQRLRAARATRAAAASGGPPTKKKALNPNAFYGSAAARILQRKGEPKAALPVKYTSSYVDEMLDYLQMEGMNGVDDLYSDEEEMNDFIASDDDDFIDDSEEVEDYSSAISKIFGYDRSRYADYDDDGVAMESSYAQQEFEETRSTRIGRQEDEEDIRREQQQFAKKQAKKNGKFSAAKSKQTKLSFR